MAARVIPIESYNQNQTINIDSTLTPSPQGCMVSGPVGQSITVTFTNNSGSTITMSFTPKAANGGMFTDITNLATGSSQAQTVPGGTGASVNYTITGNGVSTGPWAIQAGLGPMVVVIGGNNALTYTPNPVAIPLGNNSLGTGTILVRPAVAGDGYNINWNGNDPFTPALKSADGISHSLLNAQAGSYNYTAAVSDGATLNIAAGPGGRVIVVGS